MTYRTSDLMVCVYYRVAAGDATRVISTVREFQRTLASSSGLAEAQVLLRCDLPSTASQATPADVRPASSHDHPDPAGDPGADVTVMETYRLPLPADAGARDAAVRGALATLEAAALPLPSSLRGARHVELFAPCAS